MAGLTDSQLQDAILEIFKLIGASRLPSQLQEIAVVPGKTHYLHIQKGEDDGERIGLEKLRGYFGEYNASTNTPAISNATGVEGTYYKVSVAGTRDFGNGAINLEVGDIIRFEGGTWKRGVFLTAQMILDALGFTPENVANKTTTFTNRWSDVDYPTTKLVADLIQLIGAEWIPDDHGYYVTGVADDYSNIDAVVDPLIGDAPVVIFQTANGWKYAFKARNTTELQNTDIEGKSINVVCLSEDDLPDVAYGNMVIRGITFEAQAGDYDIYDADTVSGSFTTQGAPSGTEIAFRLIADGTSSGSTVTKTYVDDGDAAALQAAKDDASSKYILLTDKGQPLGVATLLSDGTIDPSQLGSLAITDVIPATEKTLTDFIAANANYTYQQGDVIIITDVDGNVSHHMFKGGNKTLPGSYSQINVTKIPISSVIGLQAALDAKQDDLGFTPLDKEKYKLRNEAVSWGRGFYLHGVADDYSDLQTRADASPYNYGLIRTISGTMKWVSDGTTPIDFIGVWLIAMVDTPGELNIMAGTANFRGSSGLQLQQTIAGGWEIYGSVSSWNMDAVTADGTVLFDIQRIADKGTTDYNDLINTPDLSGYELKTNKVSTFSNNRSNVKYPNTELVASHLELIGAYWIPDHFGYFITGVADDYSNLPTIAGGLFGTAPTVLFGTNNGTKYAFKARNNGGATQNFDVEGMTFNAICLNGDWFPNVDFGNMQGFNMTFETQYGDYDIYDTGGGSGDFESAGAPSGVDVAFRFTPKSGNGSGGGSGVVVTDGFGSQSTSEAGSANNDFTLFNWVEDLLDTTATMPVGYITGVANDYSDLDTKLTASGYFVAVIKRVDGTRNIVKRENHVSVIEGNELRWVQTGSAAELFSCVIKFGSGVYNTLVGDIEVYDFVGGVMVTGTEPTTDADGYGFLENYRGSASPADYSDVVKVSAQTFNTTQKAQARTNINAEKRSQVRIPTADPTAQNFIDWESDILLVKTARNFVLPAAGTLVNGSRYLVKTNAVGTVAFSTADGTVSIEYNDINAVGNMAERSEAWILFQDNVYYVTGEVA